MVNDLRKRLYWACRRGMLELDMLLMPFLEEEYSKLDQQNQALFERLLECNDQELFNWLMGKEQSVDEQIQIMVEMIRTHAQSKF